MKVIVRRFVLLIVFSSTAIFAEEMPEAPSIILEGIKQNCRTYAVEDNVPSEQLMHYLLKCVNDDLKDLEYRIVDLSELDDSQLALRPK